MRSIDHPDYQKLLVNPSNMALTTTRKLFCHSLFATLGLVATCWIAGTCIFFSSIYGRKQFSRVHWEFEDMTKTLYTVVSPPCFKSGRFKVTENVRLLLPYPLPL